MPRPVGDVATIVCEVIGAVRICALGMLVDAGTSGDFFFFLFFFFSMKVYAE